MFILSIILLLVIIVNSEYFRFQIITSAKPGSICGPTFVFDKKGKPILTPLLDPVYKRPILDSKGKQILTQKIGTGIYDNTGKKCLSS